MRTRDARHDAKQIQSHAAYSLIQASARSEAADLGRAGSIGKLRIGFGIVIALEILAILALVLLAELAK
jgi:hypothetical protein